MGTSLALAGSALGPPAAAAVGEPGDLTQKPGTAGCIHFMGSECTVADAPENGADLEVSPDGDQLYVSSTNGPHTYQRAADGALTPDGPTPGTPATLGGALEVSPDGKNVYTASVRTIQIFDRDPATGDLTQKTGTAGCITDDGDGGACQAAHGLFEIRTLAVSPDGLSVLAAGAGSASSLLVFDRDPLTGELTQKPGAAGCFATPATPDCAAVGVLDQPQEVVVSPDNASVYVAAYASDALVVFDRSASGTLTQKSGTSGCVSANGTGGACAVGSNLDAPLGVEISPDGANLYTYADPGAGGGFAIFDRASSGVVTQKPGASGCISQSGTGGPCATAERVTNTMDLEVSADGLNLYNVTTNSISIYDRGAGGALTQRTGPDDCISNDGSSGQCVDGRGLVNVQATTLASDGLSLYTTAFTGDGFGQQTTIGLFDRAIAGGGGGGATPGTPPETSIDKAPKKKLKTKKPRVKVTVKFSSEPGAAFECKLDKRAYKPCVSPFKAKVKAKLGKGKKHTFLVRATDAAGQTDPTPAQARFKAIRKPSSSS